MKKVAVIGSGVSGLASAWRLKDSCMVTLYEADPRPGGHANTVDVTLEGVTHGVDTGFLVYNERTYPNLIKFFDKLKVERAKSDMSFSVQVPDIDLEWCGNNLNSVFCQRRNLVKPAFWKMLSDIVRFNSLTTALAKNGQDAALSQPIDEFLKEHNFSLSFRDWYLLPMIGCIWSCPTEQMLKFPISTLIRFCHNHGLLQVSNRPQWFTVTGGSRNYVKRVIQSLRDVRYGEQIRDVEPLADGTVALTSNAGKEIFDAVILAGHSDQSLQALKSPSALQQELLSSIRYQDNVAVLHTDASMLPSNQKAWAAWNYQRASDGNQEAARVCLHYLLNKLQPIPFKNPVIVSLNPAVPLDEGKVLKTIQYAHPVFDQKAVAAQKSAHLTQGDGSIWFAGAWLGYGFHEDGFKSGLSAADGVAAKLGLALPAF